MEDEQDPQTPRRTETRGFTGGSCVSGRPCLPRSKSLAQRYLVCSSLTAQTSVLAGLQGGEDIEAAMGLVEALGIARAEGPGRLRIEANGETWAGLQGPVELGESGTLARIVTAATALCGPRDREVTLVPRGSLGARSSPALFAALRQAGASLVDERGHPTDGWPTRIRSASDVRQVQLHTPSSSQEVSGLLIALAALPGEKVLEVTGEIPSRPYLELTLSALERYRVTLSEEPIPGGARFVLPNSLRSPGELEVEPDASAAAVALAAGCLSGGEVRVESLGAQSGTRQGDVRITDYLRQAGCVTEDQGTHLQASGTPHRSFDVDLTGEPDLAPVLAAVAARSVLEQGESGAPCVLRGLETLPGKESSRIEVLARGLSELGFEVQHDERSLSITRGRIHERVPGTRTRLDPANDHRMAFCFALCSLFLPGVSVLDAHCVGKSWPTFWSDLADSGARLESS